MRSVVSSMLGKIGRTGVKTGLTDDTGCELFSGDIVRIRNKKFDALWSEAYVVVEEYGEIHPKSLRGRSFIVGIALEYFAVDGGAEKIADFEWEIELAKRFSDVQDGYILATVFCADIAQPVGIGIDGVDARAQ